jgi:hemerythrin-like domain-containing protein
MKMRGNARPSLFDTVGFDDPLEMLLACHRRIERQLDTLKRLRVHVEARGVDAEASAAAQAVLRYFLKAAAAHHEDEEKDLFPLLEHRITDPGERARFGAFRREAERDHREIEASWARLRKPLEGIGEGLTRTLLPDDVQAFVRAYSRHILTEEAALTDFFNRWLDEGDRIALGRSMSERRMVGVRGFEPPASTSRT